MASPTVSFKGTIDTAEYDIDTAQGGRGAGSAPVALAVTVTAAGRRDSRCSIADDEMDLDDMDMEDINADEPANDEPVMDHKGSEDNRDDLKEPSLSSVARCTLSTAMVGVDNPAGTGVIVGGAAASSTPPIVPEQGLGLGSAATTARRRGADVASMVSDMRDVGMEKEEPEVADAGATQTEGIEENMGEPSHAGRGSRSEHPRQRRRSSLRQQQKPQKESNQALRFSCSHGASSPDVAAATAATEQETEQLNGARSDKSKGMPPTPGADSFAPSPAPDAEVSITAGAEDSITAAAVAPDSGANRPTTRPPRARRSTAYRTSLPARGTSLLDSSAEGSGAGADDGGGRSGGSGGGAASSRSRRATLQTMIGARRRTLASSTGGCGEVGGGGEGGGEDGSTGRASLHPTTGARRRVSMSSTGGDEGEGSGRRATLQIMVGARRRASTSSANGDLGSGDVDVRRKRESTGGGGSMGIRSIRRRLSTPVMGGAVMGGGDREGDVSVSMDTRLEDDPTEEGRRLRDADGDGDVSVLDGEEDEEEIEPLTMTIEVRASWCSKSLFWEPWVSIRAWYCSVDSAG